MNRDTRLLNGCSYPSRTAGLLIAATIAFSAPLFAQSAHQHFLRAEDGKLFDGQREFRFVSFNIPNLHLNEDAYALDGSGPWRWPDEYEIRDALESIRQIGGKVARMYVISVHREGSNAGEIVHVTGPGQFNERAFESLDLVLKVANELGIRVIIPLVDNWHWWGGAAEYAAFRDKPSEAFWTDPQLIEDFQQTVHHVVGRRNTLTGTLYKDDKAIFGWETGNEVDAPASWTRQIAAAIKSVDANHLVIDGNSLRGVQASSFEDPNIDVVTTHHYPNDQGDMAGDIRNVIAAVSQAEHKKPYFVGEFGFVPLDEVERVLEVVSESECAGAMLWSLRSHRREGGFYWHSEGASQDAFKAYHWPGFDSGEGYDERSLLSLVRRMAYRVDDREPPAVDVPRPPRLLDIESPGAISWQGSTGASSYNVLRAESPDGPWTIAGTNISDAAVQYRPLFCDSTAPHGKQLFYRVVAENLAGVSEPSNTVGPLKSPWHIVDELAEDWQHRPPEVNRTIAGDVRWLTHGARRIQEDIHRLAGNRNGSVTYALPRSLRRARLVTFYSPDALDKGSECVSLSVSSDGKRFQPLAPARSVTKFARGDYGGWTPVVYEAIVDPSVGNAQTLQISFPEDLKSATSLELSRLEMWCE